MAHKTVVIKYGGHAMDHADLRKNFIENLASLTAGGMRFVLVHGGGPAINKMLDRLQITSNFHNGLRVTDGAILEVVEMTLCGQVNKEATRDLLAAGLPAAGISGEDGNLLAARLKNPALGMVGEITAVNPGIVQCLLEGGYLPVIAPLALDASRQPLNVNADTAAGAIAGALKADFFVLVSDVPGILDCHGSLYAYLTESAIKELCDSGIITGGMLPKVEACLGALRQGCKSALILDGRQPGSLKKFLLENAPLGTTISL